MPDPTTPLDLEAIRERHAAWQRSPFDLAYTTAARSADDVPGLLAALAEAQRERDEARESWWHYQDCYNDQLRTTIKVEKERDAARSDLAEAQRREELMRPVVEKAQKWRAAEKLSAGSADYVDAYEALDPLAAAVDTYEKTRGTDATER